MGSDRLTEESNKTLAGDAAQLDEARQQLAVQLARARRRARLIYLWTVALPVVLVIALPIILAPQFFGAMASILTNVPVLNWQPVAGWSPLLVLLWFILVSVPLLLLTVPFAWYISDLLPRRYGLHKGTARQWFVSFGKRFLLRWGQLGLLVEVVMLFMAVQPRVWWAWAALVQLLYSVLENHSGSLRFLPYRKDITPLMEGEIAERFQGLVTRLHIPSCHLLQFKISHRTAAANAFAIGWGRGRRVMLTDTMLQGLSPDEIEVVLAHELGHLVYRDIWTRLILRGLFFLCFFFVLNIYLVVLTAQVDQSSSLGPFQPFFPLLSSILLLVFAIVTVRYRRYQEYRADEFALRATGKVQAFKTAMTRLTNMNMLVVTSTRHARHPASHPTLLKRLKHADEFAARNAVPVEAAQI